MGAVSFDLLLSEVNSVLNKASVEEIRVSVKMSIRTVFRDIGIEFLAEPVTVEAQFKNGRWRIPEDIITIDDISRSRNSRGKGRQLPIGLTGPGIPFSQTPFEIILGNGCNETLYVHGWSFYKDEDGELIIPEDAYSACYNYCVYKGLESSRSNPSYKERLTFKMLSDQEIWKTRGIFNSNNSAKSRALRDH